MARRLASVCSLWLALAGVAGCAPGNPGLIIQNAVAPNDQCTYDTANAAIAAGTLDVSGVGASYVLALRYGNQLINLGENGSGGPPMADPNVIYVQSVEVELQDIAGNAIDVGGLPNPFTMPAGGGAVPSGDGMTFGEGIGFVQVIPPQYAAALGGAAGSTILVSVRAVGTTLGDAEVVSPAFSYPITVCSGCLFGCPLDDDGDPVCRPSCTPGQDSFQSTCEGVSDCIAGS